MSAIGRTRGRSQILRDVRGYTLVEMMIGIGIAIAIGMGLYQVFTAMQRSSVGQRLRNDVQTGCTAAMDQIKTELALGGYRAVDTATPISNASAGSITFEYWDDHAEPLVGHNNNTRVTYRRATTAETGGGPAGIKPGDLVRESYRYATPSGPFDTTPTKQVLVDNVLSLGFTYMQSDNTPWDGISLGSIKTIRPTLTCESSREDPVSKKTLKITLTGEVRARNVGVSATPKDTIPPATPAGVVAWDEGRCGELQLRWDGNTDTDLEGYVIYSGLAAGAYTKRTRLTRAPKAVANLPEITTITGLTSARSTDPAGSQPMYYIALQSFDKAGNMSAAYSTPVYGNPTGSRRTEPATAAESDTTIHPLLPPAPVLAAAPTPGPTDNSITLSWNAPKVNDQVVSGLAGYRLYRGSTPGFVIDDTPGTGNRIANETQLGADSHGWVDDDSKPLPGGRLKGCTEYYYKICAVICDTTLIASYGTAQYSEAHAAPTDNSKPPAPTLTAAPGWKRIILNLTNPVRTGMGATLDFDYTQIFYSRTGALTMDAGGNVMDGAVAAKKIPDPILTDRGTFRADGGVTINFDDLDLVTPAGGPTDPQLPAGTFWFLAVAHDLCGNTSDWAAYAQTRADQCADCDGASPGAENCLDAPYPPINVRVDTSITGSGCYGATTIAWDVQSNFIEDHPDFMAFRILRRELTGASTTFENSVNPVEELSDSWKQLTYLDGSTLDGLVYSYRVEAYDCYYYDSVHNAGFVQNGSNNPANNISSEKYPAAPLGTLPYLTVDLNGVALGTPVIDWALPVLTGKVSGLDGILGNADDSSDFFHNTATFGIRNTSNAATPKRLALDGLTPASVWENTAAFLQRLDVGDNDTTPFANAFDDLAATLTHGSTGSTVTFTTQPSLDPKDATIPVRSAFMTSSRGVDRTTDMRSNWIDYTFAYTNNSTGASGCTARTTFYTPLGPYIYGVSQDKPYFGTLGWAVHGEDGGNFIDAVTVPGGVDATVYAEVLDGSGAGISAGNVRLYTYVDAVKAYADEPAMSLFTSAPMTQGLGNQWYATIPAASDANVWYHIVAQDAHGNFDRDPEPWAGSYQYYQQAPNYCETTPNPPAITTGSISGSNVTINWAAPITNSIPANSPYSDPKGFKVYRDDGSGWTLLPSGTLDDPAATSFIDSAVPAIATKQYQYAVTAFDLCPTSNTPVPGPRESDRSNVYIENVESVCSNTPGAPHITHGVTTVSPGSVTLYWNATPSNAAPSIAPLTDLVGYKVWRQKNSGAWQAVPAYAGSTCNSVIYNSNINATGLTCLDNEPATAGVNGVRDNIFRYYVTAFDGCPTTNTPPGPNFSAGSNIYEDDKTNDACIDTPLAPAIKTGTDPLTNSNATAAGVVLMWDAPTLNNDTPATNYSDAAGYDIYESSDGGSSWSQIGTTNSTARTFPASYPTDSARHLPTNIGSVDYQYQVRAFDTCLTPNVSAPSGVYHENFNGPCGTIPNPPVIIESGTGGSSFSKDGVVLNWNAPTKNVATALYPTGQSFTDPGGYRVWRKLTTLASDGTTVVSTTAPAKIADLNSGTYVSGAGPFTYTDGSIKDTVTAGSPPTYNSDIGDPTRKYSYYVTTIDSCSPPNESGASNVYTETFTDACVGLTKPDAPSSLTSKVVGGCGGGSPSTAMELDWANASGSPSGYRVYGISCGDFPASCTGTPTTKLNSTDPLTTKLGPNKWYVHDITPTLMNSLQWRYGVKAVNNNAGCTDPSRWKESDFSNFVLDACQ